MSALHTHYKHGNDVLKKLYQKQQLEINSNINYYNMFNQGFDNLYYYLFNRKYYRDFGIKAHKKNIDTFFYELITFIKENNLQDSYEVTSMLYGFINHYTLDTIVHPYINYQVKNLDIPHTKIEFMIDGQLDSINTSYKLLISKVKFTKNLKLTINHVFDKTYQKENIAKIFKISHNFSYYIYRYFIHDKNGLKTKIYKLIGKFIPIDIILHKNTICPKVFDERILNKNKEVWHHPSNNKEIYNYSYDELYNSAVKIAVTLNKDVYKVLNNKGNIDEFIEKIKLINIKNIQVLLKR